MRAFFYRLRIATLIAGIAGTARAQTAASPYETAGPPPIANPVDALVFGRLRDLKIEPAPLCSDAVFLRRVYLDTVGLLPTAAEAREFLADASADKRTRLIERLLARDEFADYQALKWADLLRVKAEFPINLWPKAAEAYYRWIRESLADNKPYDRFARELLLATGSNFYAPPANFYRALPARQPEDIARAVALTFMGARAEAWPAERRVDLAVFFSQIRYKGTSEWKEEIVYLDRAAALPARGRLPDGTGAALPPGGDARAVFADWLITRKNPWFARAAANRVWFWLLGRGIVHEPDDLRPDNPPAVPGLLELLERELAASDWNLRRLYRLILNSSTYQLSCLPRSRDPRAAAHFAYYPLRRLEAEALIDAVGQITGTTERYVSAVPEPFTYVPEELRTVEIPDGNSSSAFLELFGKPARDTGLLLERNDTSSAAQRLHLLNSTHIHNKIAQGPALGELYARHASAPAKLVEEIYLTVLSRPPTAEELRKVSAWRESSGLRGRDLVTDLVWALINSEEFLHRH